MDEEPSGSTFHLVLWVRFAGSDEWTIALVDTPVDTDVAEVRRLGLTREEADAAAAVARRMLLEDRDELAHVLAGGQI